MSSTTFMVIVSLYGLLVGSFANVCVHRIPLKLSIVSPGSHCPSCENAIAWYDNFPVLSFLFLKGRCRYCQNPIGFRYPLVELLFALSWGVIAWHFSFGMHFFWAIAFVSWLWVLSLIDLDTGLLPNVLTFSGIAIGLAINVYLGNFLDALIGAALGYAVPWAIAMTYLWITKRHGMGFGDFKLLAMIGAFLGWQAIPIVLLVASLTGSLLGGLLLFLSRKGMRAEIPFGPYLALGAVFYLFGGGALLYPLLSP